MKNIPFGLILFRLALSPIIVFISIKQPAYCGVILAVLLVLGILSDVFDGIVARKLGVSTDGLRKWDSNVDVVFLVSNVLAAWLLFPAMVEGKLHYIISIVGFELLCYAVCLIRFKKLPSNHTYSSKLFAVFICICLVTLFVSGDWGIAFWLMFVLGVIAYLDNLIILLRLSTYAVDTKGFWKVK